MASLSDRHMETIKVGMESLLDDAELSDVTIVVNEERFPCHRTLLAAISPYFRIMFTGGMKEKHQREIVIHDIDETAFEKFRQFAYTGQLDKNDRNIVDLLRVASLFQVDCLQEHCEEILMTKVRSENCLEMYRLSTMYSCEKLRQKVWPKILDHFLTVWKKEEFDELCLDDIVKIISDDKLVSLDEEQVCEAALKWINADLDKRKQHVYHVFRHIRLPHISKEYLVTKLCTEPILIESIDTQKLLQETKDYHLLPGRRLDWSNCRTKYRADDELEEVILVVTENDEDRGSFNEGSWCLWAYSLLQHRWFTLAPIPLDYSPGKHFAVCTYSYDLYLSGGLRNPKTMLKFESERNEWTSCGGQLKKARSSHCMVAVGDALYFIGGISQGKQSMKNTVLSSIEEYYVAGQRWQTVGDLAIPVFNATAAASGENIIVFGGTHKQNHRIHTVQCFHSRNKEATVISNIPLIGNPLFCTKVDDTIYVTAINDSTNLIMKMNSSMGFEDVNFEIPTDGKILAVVHHYGFMLFLMESDLGKGQLGDIVKVNMLTPGSDVHMLTSGSHVYRLPSGSDVLPVEGISCQKPLHECRRTFVAKKFLYHTYFQ